MKSKILHQFSLYLLVLILASCNKYSSEIDKSCANCEQIEVRKSEDFILVKRHDGEGNVFSKSKMKFILDKWYPVSYDEGIIFDDITFKVDGHLISFSEDHYSMISEEAIRKKIDEFNPTASSGSDSSNENTVVENTCNICGSKFSGRGYELTYDGNCKEVEDLYQGFLCSCGCAIKARQNFNNAYDNAMNYNK